jgi:nucleoside-diphosphate-sugar epimerase
MEANADKLIYRNGVNVTAMSFPPEKVYAEIRKRKPNFKMEYQVDPLKQAIAESWPDSLDDTAAREEWGWHPNFGLATMTRDMLEKLTEKLQA